MYAAFGGRTDDISELTHRQGTNAVREQYPGLNHMDSSALI